VSNNAVTAEDESNAMQDRGSSGAGHGEVCTKF